MCRCCKILNIYLQGHIATVGLSQNIRFQNNFACILFWWCCMYCNFFVFSIPIMGEEVLGFLRSSPSVAKLCI